MLERLRTMQATSTSLLIFAAPLGGFLYPFQDHFRQAVKAAGLDSKVTPHALRHTWASRFMETSGDALLLQRAGGLVEPQDGGAVRPRARGAGCRGAAPDGGRAGGVGAPGASPHEDPRPMRRAPRNA